MAYPGLVGGGSSASDASSVRQRRDREQGLVSMSQCRELPMQKTYSRSSTEEEISLPEQTKMGSEQKG